MVPFPNIMLSKSVEQIGYTHILERSKHTVARSQDPSRVLVDPSMFSRLETPARLTAAQFAAIETSGSETLALAIRLGHGHAYLARLHTPLSLSVRPRMATACAFFPLGKCLRASAKPPPRKKGALLQRWIANGDPCKALQSQ